jgi:hypothetical protein
MYSQFLQQPAPQVSDYKPSLARRILAPILGGFEGIAGHPEMGGQFLYQPFTQKMQDYQGKANRLGAAAKEEGTQEQEKATQTELGARTEAEKQRATAETARGQRESTERQALIPGTPEAGQKEKEIRLAHPPLAIEKSTFDLKLGSGQIVKGAREIRNDETGDWYYMGPDGTKYGPGSVLEATPQNTAQVKFTNAFQAKYSSFVNEHGRPPNEQELDTMTKDTATASGLFQQREATTNLSKAKTAQIWDTVKPASPAEISEAQVMNAKNPNEYWKYLEKLPPAARRDLLLKVPPSAFLTGGQQDRVGNSNVALWHVDTLRDMLKDPFIKAHLGPIIGRITLANSKFGGDAVGGTPEEQEKEQQFLSFLTANLLWETTAGVGTRPARQTIELIQRTSPKASMLESSFLGALDAEEKSAKNVQKGLLQGNPEQVKAEQAKQKAAEDAERKKTEFAPGFSNLQEENQ